MHMAECVGLLETIVHGPSWALRRAAAYGLLEIEATVPAQFVTPAHGAAMGKLAARLVERRWRDKELGEQAAKVEAMARAHGHAPTRDTEADKEASPGAAAAAPAGGAGADEGPDSADM